MLDTHPAITQLPDYPALRQEALELQRGITKLLMHRKHIQRRLGEAVDDYDDYAPSLLKAQLDQTDNTLRAFRQRYGDVQTLLNDSGSVVF